MPSDALLNQQLLDQMFARSVAPLSTGLEQARQRAERERALQVEMNFKRELANQQLEQQAMLSREQMAAQAQLAREQQAAILNREKEVRGLEMKDRELSTLRGSNLFSEEDLAKASTDDAYRSQLLNSLTGKAASRAEKGFKTLTDEKDRLTKELAYEMENGTKSLGREAKSLAVTEFLQGLDEDSRTRIARALGRAGKGIEDLTPESLDAIMRADPGILGTKRFGFSDEERIDAMLAFKSTLDKAAIANKQAPLGAMQTMAKIQSVDSAIAERAKLFPDAYTNFIGTRLDETKKRVGELKPLTEDGWAGTNVFQGNATPAGADAANAALAGSANFLAAPQPAAAPGYGGAIGLLGKGVSALGRVPGYIESAQRSVAQGLAGVVGGQQLQQQLQGVLQESDARLAAQEQAFWTLLSQARANQENVNPNQVNFAPF